MAQFNFLSFIRNSKVDPDRPSIFPISAALNFKKELPKAFQHVTWYLAETYPAKLLWLHHFSDELYLALDAIVSVTYLKIHQGLLTENFYGLRRIEKATKLVSLIHHVFLPYLLNKLENKAKERQENVDDKISVAIEAINGTLQTIYYSLNLILNILYSSGLSRYPTVLHCLDKAELKHISAQDVNESEEKLRQMPKMVQKTLWLISILLETGAFGLQFLDYWYNDTKVLFKPSVLDTSNSIPNPPNAMAAMNKCPLCRSSTIQASTLLTTCGYVFCYHCIKSCIDETSTCPISGVSANNEQLVRIFSK